jgi:CubicO group peptidase (beta-lactamase class C family)
MNNIFNIAGITAAALYIFSGNCYAEESQKMPIDRVTNFWEGKVIQPSVIYNGGDIYKLEIDISLNKKSQIAAEESDKYLKRSKYAQGLMLIESGKIVYEGYKEPGTEELYFYSQSIAKSFVSLAFGKALCGGYVRDIDMKASEIVPRLENSNLGRSTLRQLLTMSSGLYWTKFVGWPEYELPGIGMKKDGTLHKSGEAPVTFGRQGVDGIIFGRGISNIKEPNVSEPGRYFVYKAYDPIAIGKIIEVATKRTFADFFSEEIWKNIGAESVAYWTKDKNGSNLTNAGFAARLRDYGRLAIWIVEQREKNDCFGKYLREATSKQIENIRINKSVGDSNYSGPSWRGYGYFWWTDHKDGVPGFFGKGYAGQHFGINPNTKKAIIKFSYQEDSGSGGVYDIFTKWNKSN